MRPRIINYLNQLTDSNIFSLLVPTSSIIYLLAGVIVVIVFVKRSAGSGLPEKISWHAVFWMGTGAFIGAKLFYVLLNYKAYLLQPSHIFAPGGTYSWGAYLGVIITLVLYSHHKKLPVLPMLDVLGSCIALGPFIGRWSCFLNGDDFGKLTNLALGVKYPSGSYVFTRHFNQGLIEYSADLSAAVHPNQIYLSVSALMIFFLVSRVWKKFKQYPGFTFGAYLMMYGLSRFFLEFFRDEPQLKMISWLNFPQLICLVTIMTGVVLLAYIGRSNNNPLLFNSSTEESNLINQNTN